MFNITGHIKIERRQTTHRNSRSAWAIKPVLDITSAAVTIKHGALGAERTKFFFFHPVHKFKNVTNEFK